MKYAGLPREALEAEVKYRKSAIAACEAHIGDLEKSKTLHQQKLELCEEALAACPVESGT